MGNIQIRQWLVTANIHGTNNTQLTIAGLYSLLIAFELHFLGRNIFTAHEYKLRTEQTYTLVTIFGSILSIIRTTNIGSQLNLYSILGNCRQILQSSITFLISSLLSQLCFVLLDSLLIRIYENIAGMSINNNKRTLWNSVKSVLHTYNSRNRS